MYAVIESGGKQYRVELGAEIQVDRLDVQPGDSITLERVLLVADGDATAVGRPLVDGARVSAQVLRQERGEKIVVFKYKPKARTRVKKGARADLTRLRIADIAYAGRSAADDAMASESRQAAAAQEAQEAAAAKAAADQALAAKLATAEAADTNEAADSAVAAKPKPSTRKTPKTEKAEPDTETAPGEPEAVVETEPVVAETEPVAAEADGVADTESAPAEAAPTADGAEVETRKED
jgi:large subunit ribosomal protein L21